MSTPHFLLSPHPFLPEQGPFQKGFRLKGTRQVLGPELPHALEPAPTVSDSVLQHLPGFSAPSIPSLALLATPGPGRFR